MAGNYRFSMEQKDTVKFLMTTVGSFTQDRLINTEQRRQHKDQCAERLAAEDGNTDKDAEVRYSDQAVLANLDWGIEALEEAINTSNVETKMARLDYAEKMLQVCAMLNSDQKTAGVPNYYLSAWAHLNISYLWKLRNDAHNSVLHVLDMFIVDPFFSRIDFAPELWRDLFLPHMGSIIGWYSEARQKIMIEVIPDSTDLSFTADLDQFFKESLLSSMRPDQLENLQNLEELYGESLDENTRLFAKYYRDCMNSDSTTGRKMVPMLPIAEPPMTPLHEVSRSIPDFVKFGPILPKSAGFAHVLRSKDRGASRLAVTSTSLSHDLEESDEWDPQETIPEEDEDDSDSDCEPSEAYSDSEDKNHKLAIVQVTESKDVAPSKRPSKMNSLTHSPITLSPMDTPRTSSPKTPSQTPSPSLDMHPKKESPSMLQRLSSRVRDSNLASSFPDSSHTPMDSPRTSSPKIPSPRLDMHPRRESPSVLRFLSSMDFNLATPVADSSHTSSEYNIISSPDSDREMSRSVRKNHGRARSKTFENANIRVLESRSSTETDEGSQSYTSLPLSENLTSSSRPPKDFVCPITGQIFSDPVTLETGQTYERKAIQEWLQRGNITCPITRQPLSANSLPKTNYVLKRLMSSWKEQYPDLAQEFFNSETPRNVISTSSTKESPSVSSQSRTFEFPAHRRTDNHITERSKRFVRPAVATSPTSVISQATVEAVINGLKPHVSCLCNSENLQECEAAVLAVAKLWKDSRSDPAVQSYLSEPTIVNGFAEILSASLNREVLRTSVYILSELIFADEIVGQVLTSVDSDFDCLAALLKNGLAEAIVLIYQLRPAFSQLLAHNFIPSLVQLIQSKVEDFDDLPFLMDPKDVAIAILEQLLIGGDENSRSVNSLSVVSENGIPPLVKYLDRVEARKSIVSILLCCMDADKRCRNSIASRIEPSPVLELFHSGDDSVKGMCIDFLSGLVQSNRRTLCNQILQIIRDEGSFSTMHAFLVYLQMAPMEQQPAIATLLLQLDLLVEPRKMSIYREEAVDALVEALQRKDFFDSQIMALDALASLSGRLTSSGRSYMEAWLLKIAGFDQPYNTLMKTESVKQLEDDVTETMEDEELAASSWEKRVASVLCNHEKGIIFKALEECFKSNSLETAKSCLVISTWLVYMLSILPDTRVRDVARKFLIDEFINVLQSSRNTEEKILAALALRTFVNDSAALEELGKYAKCIYKTLRKLKKSSPVITDVLKSLMNLSSVNATELWNCTEAAELDLSANGEVLSLLQLKGRILSSHADGTIKVWDAGKRVLRLIQEVREHSKAVTCLYVPPSGEKLYSGSTDKTIRVWAIKPEEIHCVQVHDVKEPVYELAANTKVACFVSQATGVKVYNWSGVPKHINFNRNVKCLAMAGDKLYCCCTGYTVQEVDLSRFTVSTFYSGTRRLLGKQSLYSLHIQDGLLYMGGSSVDGTAGKAFHHSTKAVTGLFSTGYDIIQIVSNNDFIFTATKCGIIEVWLKEKVTKVASIKVSGGHARITSIASDMDGGMLYAGSSDGKIKAWALD